MASKKPAAKQAAAKSKPTPAPAPAPVIAETVVEVPAAIVEDVPASATPEPPARRLTETVPGGRTQRADGSWQDANGRDVP